jgi:hypothetical protein
MISQPPSHSALWLPTEHGAQKELESKERNVKKATGSQPDGRESEVTRETWQGIGSVQGPEEYPDDDGCHVTNRQGRNERHDHWGHRPWSAPPATQARTLWRFERCHLLLHDRQKKLPDLRRGRGVPAALSRISGLLLFVSLAVFDTHE